MTPCRLIALLVALVCGAPASAAGPFELFGFNPRAKAMGGAQAATANDYTATFYNPALLTTRATLNFGAAIGVVQPNAFIELEQPQPDGSRYAPELPGTEGGLALGFDFPVGGKLGDHLAIGLGAYLPATEIARIRVLDPVVPQFYLYESGAARMEVMPAVAVRWLDWLSTGVGLRATGGLSGPTYYTVDPVAGTVEHREFDTALVYRFAPTLGVALGPFYGFRLGATYRGALSMLVNFPNNLDLAGMDLGMAMRVGTETVYSPHTAVLGIAYQAFEGALTLSADLQYVRWSDAPDPSVSFALDTEGDDLEHLGLGDALDIPAPGMEREVRPAFRDTLVPRAGLEFAPLDFLFVRAGYYYQPTPVPNQTSGSNYVDNNAHALSSGVGVVFSDPLEIFANPISVDASAQVLLLMERSARKANGNDPVGDWRAGGQVFDFALSIIYAY
jgi:long-chain fatty acid transport protein